MLVLFWCRSTSINCGGTPWSVWSLEVQPGRCWKLQPPRKMSRGRSFQHGKLLRFTDGYGWLPTCRWLKSAGILKILKASKKMREQHWPFTCSWMQLAWNSAPPPSSFHILLKKMQTHLSTTEVVALTRIVAAFNGTAAVSCQLSSMPVEFLEQTHLL